MKKIILGLLILVVIVGCSPQEKTGSLLFKTTDCDAPCLLGITPGTTNEADARNIISNNNLFRDCQDFDFTIQGGVRGIECESITMTLDQGLVVQIGYFSLDVTLEDVIKKYGMPDSVVVTIGSLPEEESRVKASLFFKDLYTQVTLPELASDTYPISPSTLIESVTYYSIDKYDSIVEKLTNAGGWQGYKGYLGKLP